MKIYRHPGMNTDVCVHLEWEAGRLDANGSALGIHLSGELGAFGLIDHSVWIAEENEKGEEDV
ncbi:MAG TPA: hypothetical protein VLS90_18150 [Thermodesulfobacteriota bacterium]|nr:hypothetical protein [Thermodesulfobacteriota bacterium]